MSPQDPLDDDGSASVAPRWVPLVFAVLATALVPWIVLLVFRLPDHQRSEHYRLAWVGFDIGLFACLAATAIAAVGGRPAIRPVALAAAVLLVVDAWFDVTTSPMGAQSVEAVIEAALVELPLACLCWWVHRHADQVIRCCADLTAGLRKRP